MSDRRRRVVVTLAEGFEEIEAVTPADVLHRAGLDVTLAGVGSRLVRGSHGIACQCDCEIDEIDSTPDAVVLPGGLPGAENLGKSASVERLVRAVCAQGGLCAAICAAPAYTLAAWGLLAGREATCYPSFETRFGADTRHSEERVVIDGPIVTSRGPGTALEFSLVLAARLCGEETARELSARMLAPVR